MNLLFDAHCFDYNTSEGVNSYIRGLYSKLILIAKDIHFFIVAANIDKVKTIFGEHENVTYISLTSKNKIYRLLVEIPHIIKKNRIDVAHFQYISPLIKNCRTIVTLHDILFKDFPSMFPLGYKLGKEALFKFSAKRADLLLTVSKYSQDRIAYHYGIPKDKIIVTPNAVSIDFENIDRKLAKRFVVSKGIDKYILYVSRIEPRKNQVSLLHAYIDLNLAEKGYHLVFIGRKTLNTPELDRLIASMENKQGKYVHFINQVSYEELKMWYCAASLFVYPSLAEGFGIPPVEAGVAGIPCICNNQTAMSDFTFFGDNLINIKNIDLLEERIIANLENQPDTIQIKKTIMAKYNWNEIANNLYKILMR
jgi:glycosyltransferase involved in cell wall biosynthesis